MESKTFEIRDEGTFIPVLAVKLRPYCEADRYLLARAGYGPVVEDQEKYVLVARLAGGNGQATSDPFEWHDGGARTMHVAHQEIEKHFDDYKSGAVIDVQFILGETVRPKKSEAEWKGHDGR